MKYPAEVNRLFEAFAAAGHDLYLVGGAVRDHLLGEPADALDDLDFCTDARPATTANILKNADFHLYKLGEAFGTVGAVIHGDDGPGYPKDCQITTYRSEEYYRRGSRHPSVEFGQTIEQDLGRRDFSINSMALDGQAELFDPYDGQKDLQDGILRVIGDPLETLAEDPLRILRVGRFMSKLGFEPTAELRAAAAERADGILDISAERWFQEMTKLVKGAHVAQAIRFLHEIRILGIILPEADSLFRVGATGADAEPDFWAKTLAVLEHAPADGRLRWAALLHHIGKPGTRLVDDDGRARFPGHHALAAMLAAEIARRFRFDNDTADEVRAIIGRYGPERDYRPGWSDAQVRRYVRRVDPYVDSMLAFGRATVLGDDRADQHAELARIDQLAARIDQLADARALRPTLPSGLGYALIDALDLEPSPLIGRLKEWLDEAIIEDRIESRREADYYIDYLRQAPPSFLVDVGGHPTNQHKD